MPSSLACAIETTLGQATWGMSARSASLVWAISGVSLPSGVGTVSSFSPAIASGAAVSSIARWAVSGQITAWWGLAIARSAATLVPVPFSIGKIRACGPNSA